MFPRASALLAALALAGGLSACGADDEFSSDIPRTSPDLTIPTATTEVPDAADTSTSATTATTTSTVPDTGAAAPPAAVAAAGRRPAAGPAPGLDDGRRNPARRPVDHRRRHPERPRLPELLPGQPRRRPALLTRRAKRAARYFGVRFGSGMNVAL